MWLIDLAIAFVVGVLLAAVFAGAFRRDRSWEWGAVALFFAIVFLGSWAGGVWVRPVGPPWVGVYWTPFLLVGVVIALLIVTLLPARSARSDAPARSPNTVELVEHSRAEVDQAEAGGITQFGLLFWMLIATLFVLVVVGYVV